MAAEYQHEGASDALPGASVRAASDVPRKCALDVLIVCLRPHADDARAHTRLPVCARRCGDVEMRVEIEIDTWYTTHKLLLWGGDLVYVGVRPYAQLPRPYTQSQYTVTTVSSTGL